MFFADAHCDTITTALSKKEELFKNSCHIDIDRLLKFDSPVQVFSVWLEKQKLSSPFFYTMQAIDFFKKEVYKNNAYIDMAVSYSDLLQNIRNNKISGILGIEGGEALEGKFENVYRLFECGVRVFTLTWNFENEIGFGAVSGSYEGLKPFGKDVVKTLDSLNAIIDVSHINEQGFWDLCHIYDKPFIASHSNSKKICDNPRNLTDEQIIEISKRKGIIGINLYPYFIEKNGKADIKSIIRHIDHILTIAGEDVIGFGCDFDGISSAPENISDVSDIFRLYDSIKKYFGINAANKFMGNNLLQYFSDNFV